MRYSEELRNYRDDVKDQVCDVLDALLLDISTLNSRSDRLEGFKKALKQVIEDELVPVMDDLTEDIEDAVAQEADE